MSLLQWNTNRNVNRSAKQDHVMPDGKLIKVYSYLVWALDGWLADYQRLAALGWTVEHLAVQPHATVVIYRRSR
jgi:hypothetical protein